MSFLAPLVEAIGPMLARVGASAAGKAAGSAAESAAGGGGSEAALGKMTKSGSMPIPSMGSNGGSNSAQPQAAASVLNADQFR